MKNPAIRIIPARENLLRLRGEGTADLDVTSIDLVLRMMNAVDVMKGVIFEELKAQSGLSEGKFTLLMCLRLAEHPLTVCEISHKIGVAPPTVSVMLGRMLEAKKPLVERRPSKSDARVSLVELTPAGRELLDMVLPVHFRRVEEFASGLNYEERETLIGLLAKLTAPFEAPEKSGKSPDEQP